MRRYLQKIFHEQPTKISLSEGGNDPVATIPNSIPDPDRGLTVVYV